MFAPRMKRAEESPPAPERAQATTDCEIITMVKTLNRAIAAISQDTARIQRAHDQLRTENMARDKALENLSAMVKEYSSSPATMRPHTVIQSDVLDEEGNLRATDIGITWEGNEMYLPSRRPGSWTGPTTTSRNGAGDVDTISTDTRARPGEYVHNGNSSGRGDPTTPPSTRDTSGVSTGGPHAKFQQQFTKLAGVVSPFPGGH